ncbi:MAG: spermidine synthase, partial [Deltaproteobacteria bacterium]|nr:spermidine synthase [Deltaproteobacteria bacterium]
MSRGSGAGRAVAIAVVFALSGMAGLAYEIVWVRQITLLIGSTTWAVSLTVAGFLLGLTLGALLGGRLADRSRRWLFLYGAMEVAVGIFGVA